MAGKQGGNNSKITTTAGVAGLHTVAMGDIQFEVLSDDNVIKVLNEFKKDILKEVASGKKGKNDYEAKLAEDVDRFITYIDRLSKNKNAMETVNGERIPVYRLLREEFSQIMGKTFGTDYGKKYIEKYGKILDLLEMIATNMAYKTPTKSGYGGKNRLTAIEAGEVYGSKKHHTSRTRGSREFTDEDATQLGNLISKALGKKTTLDVDTKSLQSERYAGTFRTVRNLENAKHYADTFKNGQKEMENQSDIATANVKSLAKCLLNPISSSDIEKLVEKAISEAIPTTSNAGGSDNQKSSTPNPKSESESKKPTTPNAGESDNQKSSTADSDSKSEAERQAWNLKRQRNLNSFVENLDIEGASELLGLGEGARIGRIEAMFSNIFKTTLNENNVKLMEKLNVKSLTELPDAVTKLIGKNKDLKYTFADLVRLPYVRQKRKQKVEQGEEQGGEGDGNGQQGGSTSRTVFYDKYVPPSVFNFGRLRLNENLEIGKTGEEGKKIRMNLAEAKMYKQATSQARWDYLERAVKVKDYDPNSGGKNTPKRIEKAEVLEGLLDEAKTLSDELVYPFLESIFSDKTFTKIDEKVTGGDYPGRKKMISGSGELPTLKQFEKLIEIAQNSLKILKEKGKSGIDILFPLGDEEDATSADSTKTKVASGGATTKDVTKEEVKKSDGFKISDIINSKDRFVGNPDDPEQALLAEQIALVDFIKRFISTKSFRGSEDTKKKREEVLKAIEEANKEWKILDIAELLNSDSEASNFMKSLVASLRKTSTGFRDGLFKINRKAKLTGKGEVSKLGDSKFMDAFINQVDSTQFDILARQEALKNSENEQKVAEGTTNTPPEIPNSGEGSTKVSGGSTKVSEGSTKVSKEPTVSTVTGAGDKDITALSKVITKSFADLTKVLEKNLKGMVSAVVSSAHPRRPTTLPVTTTPTSDKISTSGGISERSRPAYSKKAEDKLKGVSDNTSEKMALKAFRILMREISVPEDKFRDRQSKKNPTPDIFSDRYTIRGPITISPEAIAQASPLKSMDSSKMSGTYNTEYPELETAGIATQFYTQIADSIREASLFKDKIKQETEGGGDVAVRAYMRMLQKEEYKSDKKERRDLITKARSDATTSEGESVDGGYSETALNSFRQMMSDTPTRADMSGLPPEVFQAFMNMMDAEETGAKGFGEKIKDALEGILDWLKQLKGEKKESGEKKKSEDEEEKSPKHMAIQSLMGGLFGEGVGNLTGSILDVFEKKKEAEKDGEDFELEVTDHLGVIAEVIQIIVGSSPMLKAVLQLFQLASTLFFMPFGNILGEFLLPLVISLIDWVVRFNEWISDLNWSNVKSYFGEIWNGIKEWFGSIPSRISGFFKNIISTITGVFEWLWGHIGGILGKIWDSVKSIFTKIVDLVQAFFKLPAQIGNAVWNAIKGVGSSIWDGVTGVFGFAGGGYIPPTPGGTLIRVAEGTRGEHIVPDGSQMYDEMNGGGTVINITFSGPVYGMNDFEDKVNSIISKTSNRGYYR